MPLFEYSCNKCGHITEVLHKSSEVPCVLCEECESDQVEKIMSGFAFKVKHDTKIRGQYQDYVKKQDDMRHDLKSNYGVEEVKPIGRNTFEDTYKEIKSNGSSVKESMIQTREENQKKQSEKNREFHKKSLENRDKQMKALKERKSKKEYNDRKVGNVTSKINDNK